MITNFHIFSYSILQPFCDLTIICGIFSKPRRWHTPQTDIINILLLISIMNIPLINSNLYPLHYALYTFELLISSY